jgi:2-polyprenyl-3-methyl-5-hydroxy-6-metoxy-1,4-benzoquinol methylase
LDYNQGYFEKTGQKTDGDRAQAFARGLAQIRFQHFERHLRGSLSSEGTCLEIGPGEGHLAEIILQYLPRINYIGIETDTSCHPSLQKKGVTLLNSSTALPPLDLVILSHVLEHVTDPRGLLEKIRASLKPFGLVFIEVPCQDFTHKRVDEPHLLFF